MSKSSAPTPACSATNAPDHVLYRPRRQEPVRLDPLLVKPSLLLRRVLALLHLVVFIVIGVALLTSALDGLWRFFIGLVSLVLIAISWRRMTSLIPAGMLMLTYELDATIGKTSQAIAELVECDMPDLGTQSRWYWQVGEQRECLGELTGARLWQSLVIVEFSWQRQTRYLPIAIDALDGTDYAALRRWLVAHLRSNRDEA